MRNKFLERPQGAQKMRTFSQFCFWHRIPIHSFFVWHSLSNSETKLFHYYSLAMTMNGRKWGAEVWPRHLAPHFFLICGTGKFHQEKQTFNTALLFDGPKIKTSPNIPSPFSCKLYGWISKGRSCKGLRWGNGTAPLCSPTSKLESTSRANRNEVSIMFWRVVDRRKILTTVRWSKFRGTLSNTTFLKNTQKIWPGHLEGQPFFPWALGICM